MELNQQSNQVNTEESLSIDFDTLDLPDLPPELQDFSDFEINEPTKDNQDQESISEEVSLSDEELDNIIGLPDVEEESKELVEAPEIENIEPEEELEKEEVSLSDEELDNIIGLPDVEEESKELVEAPEIENIEPEDQLEKKEVSLSDEELDNIIGLPDVEEGSKELVEAPEIENIESEDQLEKEELSLSDEELEEDSLDELKVEPIEIDLAEENINENNHLKEDDSQELLPVNQEDVVLNDIDEPINLSEDELEDILGDASESESNEPLELKISDDELSQKIVSEEDTSLPPLSEVEIEEDDSISLTPEELENIVSNEDIEVISEELKDELEQEATYKQDLEEINNIEIPTPIFEDNTEETISLTDDELKNIVGELEESVEISIPEPEIYDVKTSQQIRQEKREQLTDDLEKETGIKKEELKKVIAYLDSLFDQLPEETIRAFSKSEYFNLYKKIIEGLGIYPPDSN
jgi:hypothetical protein